MAFLIRTSFKLANGKEFFQAYCKQLQTTGVHLIPHKEKPGTIQPNDTTNSQKNLKESPKITLIQNQNITVTALEEAKNLATRRSLHLVKVQDMDTKTRRPVYKLLTAAEMFQNELSDMKKSEKSAEAVNKSASGVTKKSEKALNIGCRIAEHDLSARLKNISKWLSKQHDVRILIQGSSDKDIHSCEKIFKAIEESVNTPQVIGKIVQKRTKGTNIKFSLLPVAKEKSASQ